LISKKNNNERKEPIMSKQTAQGSPDGPRYIYGKENVNWGGPKRASHSSPQGDVSSALGDFSHSQGEQPVYTQKEALNTLRGDVLDNADEYDKTEEGARNRAIAQEFILESAAKNSPKEVVEQIKKNIADGMNPVEAMESVDYKLSRPRSNKIDSASDKEIIYVGHPLNKRQNIYETNRKNPAIATTYELSWKDKVSSYDTYKNTGNKNEMTFTDRQHFLTVDAEKHGIHYHSACELRIVIQKKANTIIIIHHLSMFQKLIRGGRILNHKTINKKQLVMQHEKKRKGNNTHLST